jgi:hypothetical protein
MRVGRKETMNELDGVVQSRYQQAGEQLLGDSSLRDALNDEQAHQLLAWGLAQVKREAEASATLSEAEAEPLLQQRVETVRRVMRHLNHLVQGLAAEPKSNVREDMAQMIDALTEIDADALQVKDIFALEDLVTGDETLDRNAIFEQLMDIVRQVGEVS